MSKRPKSGDSRRSGRQSLISYLRDRPIGIKLGFITFVPTLAIIVVGASGLATQISTTNNADRARTLATLTQYSGALVDALQQERSDVTIFLGTQPDPKDQNQNVVGPKNSYNAQIETTLAASNAYQAVSTSQAGLPASFRTLLSRISSEIGDLGVLRQEIASGTIPLAVAMQQYNALIGDLLQIRDNASQLAGDTTLSFEMRAAAAIASDKEYASQERDLVLEGILQGSMPPALRHQVIAAESGQTQAEASFEVVATPVELAYYNQTVSGSGLRPSQVDQSLIDQGTSDVVPPGLNPTDWDQDWIGRASLLRLVEENIDRETVSDATALRNRVQNQIIVDFALLFGLVLIAMGLAWIVARAMSRSLRELKQGALNVAQNGLPQAVARLRDPALATQASPQQLALQIAEPLTVRGKDEFGEVTEAFNAVHLEAVRTAAEQAQLRSSVATMFINLARRSQILVDRLIGHLDQVERGEENPDRLAELFQLDHLATRMRRNDENLLVLAGADSTRVQREPAALVDVLRAAQSEVEHYTRLEFGIVDRDIEIAAHAVNDLVHLVAELFDNATAFSPPDAIVIVEARRVGEHVALVVEDHGIGVSPEQLIELNERLATPPMVDVAVSRMMGLVVVARLAYRHGVRVELRPAPQHGLIADVLLPPTVLVGHALAGRSTAGPGIPAEPLPIRPRPPQPPPATPIPTRSPFGPPLALESGPSAASRNGGAPVGAGMGGPGAFGAPPGTLGGFADNYDAFEAGARELLANLGPNKSLPSWSDLTGSPEAPSPNLASEMFGPRQSLPGMNPLPQRRTGDPAPSGFGSEERPWYETSRDEPAYDGGAYGTQQATARPWDDGAAFAGTGQGLGQGLSQAFGNGGYPTTGYPDPAVSGPGPTAGAPPAWPPVAVPAPRDDGSQVQLGSGAMRETTSEIPRIRDLDLAGAIAGDHRDAAGAYAPPSHPWSEAAGDAPAYGARTPVGDETMELPIFRALESAWFREVDTSGHRVVHSHNTTGEAGIPVDQLAAESGVRLPTGDGRSAAIRPGSVAASSPDDTEAFYLGTQAVAAGSTIGEASMAAGHTVSTQWRSPADEGWGAAAAALDPPDGGLTDGGLPRRVPMAQLVPGSVETGGAGAHHRSPEAVRGLLSAYTRGVQRGRAASDQNNTVSESMTGNMSPGGREQ